MIPNGPGDLEESNQTTYVHSLSTSPPDPDPDPDPDPQPNLSPNEVLNNPPALGSTPESSIVP